MLKKYKLLSLFILVFTIVNVLQGIFTELGNDECYYWMFSQNLDWGYFDHPPMVALMISMGYKLFSCELGINSLGSALRHRLEGRGDIKTCTLCGETHRETVK